MCNFTESLKNQINLIDHQIEFSFSIDSHHLLGHSVWQDFQQIGFYSDLALLYFNIIQ